MEHTDCNVVVLSGRISAPIEITRYPSGSVAARLLVAVKTLEPVRRIDVLPVTMWDPPDSVDPDLPAGTGVRVHATVRRHFWAAADGRRSRLELVALELDFDEAREPDPQEAADRPAGATAAGGGS